MKWTKGGRRLLWLDVQTTPQVTTHVLMIEQQKGVHVHVNYHPCQGKSIYVKKIQQITTLVVSPMTEG